ncbi:MAG: hypothetical protein L6R40_005910 [Gallowayella cf. fulva]|nr:MAG: hypothetical protein L6R40_005910 [Xanthomendoza cf. fulva]
MDTATHLEDAAGTVTGTANAATTAAVPLLPKLVVSMATAATTTRNVAQGVARPRIPTVAVPVTATQGSSAAGMVDAHPKAASAVGEVLEFATRSGGSGGSGNSGGEAAPRPVSPSSSSVPDVSISSFNPADYSSLPSVTTHSLPSLPSVPTNGGAAAVTSFSLPTLTAQSTPGAVLQTFTSTITIRYYTIFITTTTYVFTETVFITSKLTSLEKEVTALATDSLDAALIFDTLALSAIDAPTQRISGIGVSDFSQTRDEYQEDEYGDE